MIFKFPQESRDYILVDCTWNSIAKWSSRKKKPNIDRHGEIYNEFFIASYIHLGIFLEYNDFPSQPSTFQVSIFKFPGDVERYKVRVRI